MALASQMLSAKSSSRTEARMWSTTVFPNIFMSTILISKASEKCFARHGACNIIYTVLALLGWTSCYLTCLDNHSSWHMFQPPHFQFFSRIHLRSQLHFHGRRHICRLNTYDCLRIWTPRQQVCTRHNILNLHRSRTAARTPDHPWSTRSFPDLSDIEHQDWEACRAGHAGVTPPHVESCTYTWLSLH